MGFDKQDSIGNSKGKKVDMNLKKRMENRNEFNSILKYDYGMPNQVWLFILLCASFPCARLVQTVSTAEISPPEFLISLNHHLKLQH